MTYSPSLEDFASYLFTQDSGIEMRLGSSDWWVMRMGVANSYNSKPATWRDKLDTLYYTHLILSWE